MVAFHDNLLPGRGTAHLLLNIIDTSFQCGTSLKGTLCTQQLIIKIVSKLCALQFYLTVKSTGYTTSCHLTVRRAENICWFHFYKVQRHIECFSNNLCDLHNKVKTREPCSYWEDTRYIHSYAPYTCRYDWITRHTHQGGGVHHYLGVDSLSYFYSTMHNSHWAITCIHTDQHGVWKRVPSQAILEGYYWNSSLSPAVIL